MPRNHEPIELSVVVAAPDAGPNLARCLAALKEQVAAVGGEILLIDGSTDSLSPLPESMGIRMIRGSAGAEVPKLWQLGVEASKGSIIALLVESCLPAADWAENVLIAHRARWAVIGGAIDLSATCRFVDSAVYFCRYSRYMPPFAPHFPDDLPGNNCSYKRTRLNGLQEVMEDGFWETFIHRELRARGDELLCEPDIVVRYVGPTSGLSFFRVRFLHGCRFAARRANEMNLGQRLLKALIFPVVPFVMLGRIASCVWAKRRYRARFLACVPFLMAFLASWSVGEFFGYVSPHTWRRSLQNKEKSPVLREVG